MVGGDAQSAALQDCGPLHVRAGAECCINLRAARVRFPTHEGGDVRVGLWE